MGGRGMTERKGRQDAKDVSLRATNHPSVHRVLFQPGGGRILTKPSLFATIKIQQGEREREREMLTFFTMVVFLLSSRFT